MPFPSDPSDPPHSSGPPTGDSWLYGRPEVAPVAPAPGPAMFDWSAPTTAMPLAAPTAPPYVPPVPPPFGSVAPAPGPVGPPSKRSRSAAVVAALVAVTLVIGAVGGAAVARSLHLSTSGSALNSASGSVASGSSGSTGSSSGSGSSSSSGSGSSGSSASGSGSGSSTQPLSSWTQVASVVDPGVVDIESRLSNGIGAGTGMVLTATGEVLTNNHVVDGATEIVVTVTATGDTYSATVVGTDPSHDVAVIQMSNARGLTPIPLGDSDKVAVGDQVAAIGNAGGQGGKPAVVSGQVTALDQQITASDQNGSNSETLAGLIQVAADVVPGDSGGPLANTSGQVIGMDTAASASSSGSGGVNSRGRAQLGSSGNVGFAIPINQALSIAKSIEANPTANRSGSGSTGSGSTSTGSQAFLGVQVQAGAAGVQVVVVQAGSPAAKAKLAAGDVIVSIDGSSVGTPDDVSAAIAGHQPGDKVTVEWQSSTGTSHHSTVSLATR